MRQLTVIVALLAVLGVRADPWAARPVSRLQRIFELLKSTSAGREVSGALDGADVRFTGGESMLQATGTIVLSPRAHENDDRKMAARLGHLLLHRSEATKFELPLTSEQCRTWVLQVSRLERKAYALENSIGVELGLTEPVTVPLDLEPAYRLRCERGARG